MMSDWRGRIAILTVFFLILFLPFRKLWFDQQMLAWGDNQPLPVSSAQAFKGFLSAWQPLNRGIDNGQGVSILFQGFLIRVLNENSVLAQKIYLFLPFSLAFIFVFAFLSNYIVNQYILLIASLFYVFNPATFGTLTGGAVGMIYVHAFLPLAYLFISKLYTATADLAKKTLYFALLCFALSILFIFGSYSMLLVLPGFSYYFVRIVLAKKKTPVLRYILSVCLVFTFVFFLTLPTSFDFLGWFKSGASTQALSLPIGSLLEEVKSNYSNALVNNLDLAGTYGAFPVLRWLRLVGTFIIFVLLLPFFIWDHLQKEMRRMILIDFFGILFVWMFILLTSKGLTLPVFSMISILFLFRSPAKLILFMALMYSFLLGLVLDCVLGKAGRRYKALLLAACSLLLVLSNLPFLDGSLLLSTTKAGSVSYKVPENFLVVGRWLKEAAKTSPGGFRTLWVPYSYEEEEIKLRFVDENQAVSPLGLSQFLSFNAGFLGKIYKNLCVGSDETSLTSALSEIAIKYIIVNGYSSSRGLCRVDQGRLLVDPEAIRERLGKNQSLSLAFQFGDTLVYENKNWYPKVVSIQTTSIPDTHSYIKIPEELSESDEVFGLYTAKYIDSAKAIYLSEFYHSGWDAFIDGKKIEHLKTKGFGNYFLNVQADRGELKIKFSGQDRRDLILRIWSYSWGVWFVIFLFGTLRGIRT